VDDLSEALIIKVGKSLFLVLLSFAPYVSYSVPWDVQEWKPPPAPICRSRPVHQVENDETTINAEGHSYKPPVTALFDDCRSLEAFSWSDDSVSRDEDDGESAGTGSYAGMDLVRAGVFKRSFDVLKKQPRCKLCSVCYQAGDRVAVLRDPPCSHEFHTCCVLSWLERNPNTCPLCASGDAIIR